MPPDLHEGVHHPVHERGSQGQEGRRKKLVFLAHCLKAHPSQLRADLQRYYGLNLDCIGVGFSAFHAAECAANLPIGSSLGVKLIGQQLTAENIVYAMLSGIIGGEKQKGIEGIDTESVPLDEFIDWYKNTKWKEVEGWQEIQ